MLPMFSTNSPVPSPSLFSSLLYCTFLSRSPTGKSPLVRMRGCCKAAGAVLERKQKQRRGDKDSPSLWLASSKWLCLSEQYPQRVEVGSSESSRLLFSCPAPLRPANPYNLSLRPPLPGDWALPSSAEYGTLRFRLQDSPAGSLEIWFFACRCRETITLPQTSIKSHKTTRQPATTQWSHSEKSRGVDRLGPPSFCWACWEV